MANNFNKNRIFRNIAKSLNSLIIMRYESKNSHANNVLKPLITLTLIRLYEDGAKSFSYAIGGNSDIERALFCLNRLRMIHTYNEHVRHHRQYVSCSLTNTGSAYAQFITSRVDSRYIRFILNTPYRLIHRFLLNACLEIVPPISVIFYMSLNGALNDVLISICMAWYWLGVFILSRFLHTAKTKHRFIHFRRRDFNNSKIQFLKFCDQYNLWRYMDPHDLMRMIDRYMFNNGTYHKRSLVARNDGPWNVHFHDFEAPS